MDKIYNITGILFDNEYMVIRIDDSELRVRISDASGYGIHWKKLDEDLSVNGLMKLARERRVSSKEPVR